MGGTVLRPRQPDFDDYLGTLECYLHPRAKGTTFSAFYLRFFPTICTPSPGQAACLKTRQ